MDRKTREILVQDSRSGNMTMRLVRGQLNERWRLRWLIGSSGALKILRPGRS